jgi:hypothetical protein
MTDSTRQFERDRLFKKWGQFNWFMGYEAWHGLVIVGLRVFWKGFY